MRSPRSAWPISRRKPRWRFFRKADPAHPGQCVETEAEELIQRQGGCVPVAPLHRSFGFYASASANPKTRAGTTGRRVVIMRIEQNLRFSCLAIVALLPAWAEPPGGILIPSGLFSAVLIVAIGSLLLAIQQRHRMAAA